MKPVGLRHRCLCGWPSLATIGLVGWAYSIDAQRRGRRRSGQAPLMIVRPKHQRLVLVVLAVAALVGAVLLAMWGLKDRAAYFVTPSDIAAGKTTPDKAMRLGGMVVKGSLKRDPDGLTVRFTVSDSKAETPVVYPRHHARPVSRGQRGRRRRTARSERTFRGRQYPRQA